MTSAFATGERSTTDDGTSEAVLAERAIAGDPLAFRMIMARYNQRLFRIARGIVRDDSVAEDVVQEAYVNAFQHLGSFRADASLSTWLHRIVMNEALGRLRKASRSPEIAFPIIRQSAEVVQFPSRAVTIRKNPWHNGRFCGSWKRRQTSYPAISASSSSPG